MKPPIPLRSPAQRLASGLFSAPWIPLFSFFPFLFLNLAYTAQALEFSAWDWLPPVARLRQQQLDTEARLSRTPPAPPVQLGPRIGWHSQYGPSQDRVEWVELDFNRDVPLDLVALVPVTPHSENLTPGAGFPLRFKIEAFSSQSPQNPRLLFDHTHADFPNPGTLPVTVACERLPVSRIRITATRLSGPRGRSFFALGEVFVFDGQHNRSALIEKNGVSFVTASSSEGSRPDWGRINLVDGQSGLGLPEGDQTSPSLGFSSKRFTASEPVPELSVTVDLGQPYPIDEIRLFPARPPEFSHSFNFGFPELYRIELRETETSAPVEINPPNSGGYGGAPGNSCAVILGDSHAARYVTVVALKAPVTNGAGYLALSELEVWSAGLNVARHKTVHSPDSLEKQGWSAQALVDGFTSRANLVELAPWLKGLSERRALQHRLTQIHQDQEAWQEWIRRLLQILGAGGLLATLLFVAFERRRQRKERDQELQALRQRFAQDLHDDIGSNLGSIVLMAEQALELTGDPELKRELRSIQETATDSVGGLRQLVEAHRDGRGTFLSLEAQLLALIERFLHGLAIRTEISIPPNLALPAPFRRELLLCLKEIFHNIRRHARARAVSLALTLPPGQHRLEIRVQDDGCGFNPTPRPSGLSSGNGLSNLRHRASTLGGQIHFESAPGQGTVVTLSLPLPF